MSDIERRFEQLEQRLSTIEQLLGSSSSPAVSSAPTPMPSPSVTKSTGPVLTRLQPAQSSPTKTSETKETEPELLDEEADRSWSVTNILGWGGMTALVWAAAYMIRLAIDSGWLTPTLQVFSVVVTALCLIGAGIRLRESNHEYAGLLPAAGVVILFLSVYGAHLYYDLISATIAGGAIIFVCITSLWLCWMFQSHLYALFAVVGSYSAPFLLPALGNDITDLAIYYSAWSLLFCAFSIWIGNRQVYLLALYMGLVGFDILQRLTTSPDWVAVLFFQLIQFILFVICAATYSIMHRAPMTKEVAVVHAPALLIFYCLEYILLDRYLPAYAPWIAVASAGFLALSYRIALNYLTGSLTGARWLLSAYAALVLFHAGYLESIPAQWGPWAAFLFVIVAVFYGWLRQDSSAVGLPLGFVILLIFAGNYLRLIFGVNETAVPGYHLLITLYAVELYVGYYFVRQIGSLNELCMPLIYSGHIAAMAAAVHILDGRFAVSLSWGILALACLLFAINQKDKMLGQSSLLVFAVSATKVFLYDLSGASPLARIACLLVLGVTFYMGGWLYKEVNKLEPAI